MLLQDWSVILTARSDHPPARLMFFVVVILFFLHFQVDFQCSTPASYNCLKIVLQLFYSLTCQLAILLCDTGVYKVYGCPVKLRGMK